MNPDLVLAIAHDAGRLVLLLAGPLLGAALATGLAVSVIQAVTQVQEASLTFIPKLVATLVTIAVLGHWMLAQLLGYTVALLGDLSAYGR